MNIKEYLILIYVFLIMRATILAYTHQPFRVLFCELPFYIFSQYLNLFHSIACLLFFWYKIIEMNQDVASLGLKYGVKPEELKRIPEKRHVDRRQFGDPQCINCSKVWR